MSGFFKQEASRKINDYIPENQLEIISFHLSELTKTNSPVEFIKKKEFRYKGELYDIYKEIIKDDSIHYYCINDTKENILENAFAMFVESKTQDNSKNTPIHNILVNIFKIAIIPAEYNNSYYQSSFKFITHIDYLHPQYSVEIPTPPPKS